MSSSSCEATMQQRTEDAPDAPESALMIYDRIPLIERTTAGEQSREFNYVPYMPVYDRNAITFPVEPPILKSLRPLLYTLPKELGGSCQVMMKLIYPESPDFSVDFPLQLSEYLELNKDRIYTLPECRACDEQNQAIFDHNEFIVKLLTCIVKQNGCKTSAGTITQQGKPNISAFETYQAGVVKFANNHYERLRYAITYLHDLGLFPCSDYDFSYAVELVDIISYFKCAIGRLLENQRAIGNNVRLRFTGQPPIQWDGIAPQRSIDGSLVCWIPNNMHLAKYPNCIAACKSIQARPVPAAASCGRGADLSGVNTSIHAEDEPLSTSIVFEGLCEHMQRYGAVVADGATPASASVKDKSAPPSFSCVEAPTRWLSSVQSFATFNNYVYNILYETHYKMLHQETAAVEQQQHTQPVSDTDSSDGSECDTDDDDGVSSDDTASVPSCVDNDVVIKARDRALALADKIVSFVYSGHPRCIELKVITCV